MGLGYKSAESSNPSTAIVALLSFLRSLGFGKRRIRDKQGQFVIIM